MLENKENPVNAQGNRSIIFAKGSSQYDKPSKPAIKRAKARRRIEDIKHNKEMLKLWDNL